jgi:plastocyanin
MKKLYSFILSCALLTLFAQNAQGTVWNVSVLASSFSPNTLPNVVCGDTVRWTYGSGTPHTTTSTTIPVGAPVWDAPINTTTTTFDYVVSNVVGVYNYRCTPHGFTGSFTVSCSVGMNGNVANVSSAIYPSPFFSKVTIRYKDVDELRIANITGKLVKTIPLNVYETKAEIYLDDLAPGVYFYSTVKDGIIREIKKIVKAQ